jgi:hypothetical protein
LYLPFYQPLLSTNTFAQLTPSLDSPPTLPLILKTLSATTLPPLLTLASPFV